MGLSSDLSSKITDYSSSLGPSQRKIAQYILDHSAEIPRLDLEELAERLETSRSSVIRLCRRIGLEGYRDLQKHCVSKNDFVDSFGTLPWCYDAAAEVVEQTFAQLDRHDFLEVLDRCATAERVFWYGLGESGLLASIGNYKCWHLGINSAAFVEPAGFRSAAAMLKPNDVLITISMSGNGDYLREPVSMARQRGLYLVGMTSDRFSWLAKNVDMTLYAAAKIVHAGSEFIGIKAGFEALITSLAIQICEYVGKTSTRYED